MDQGNSIPYRRTGLLERDTGDAVVVMTETGEVLHTLQGTALFIWKQIDGKRSKEGILAGLLCEYDVDRERAAEDVDAFLKSLESNELISFTCKE